MSLREAVRVIHADRDWWRKVLIGGALMCSLFGYPLAAGLVVESLDNTRKGFPTPLPPWVDLSTRYIIGLFAFLIDFFYFILPLFIAGVLFFCVGFGVVLTRTEPIFTAITGFGGLVLMATLLGMFVASASPVGRLIFIQDSSPENAMSIKSLQEALRSKASGFYLRARLISLPAYLPAVLFATLLVLVIPSGLPLTWLFGMLLYWLTMSSLLYAHLIVIQIYAGAEHELQQRGLERPL
jgi:hypothetical protein